MTNIKEEKMGDIRIGSKVKILYWRHNIIVEGEIVDIFFERYLFDYKIRLKVEFFVPSFDCWVIETYYINDFFVAMQNAMKLEEENTK